MKRMKILRASTHIGAVGLIVAVAILILFYRPVSLGGDTQYFFVSSGSMEPTVPVGSIVVVKPVGLTTLKEGDIICFGDLQEQLIITHRIVEITYDGFITKGDANEESDPFIVEKKDVIGKVVFTIPYLGYLSYFVKTPFGFMLLIILPATIIIAREIRSIINHRKTTNQQKDKITSQTRRKKQIFKKTMSLTLMIGLLSLISATATTSRLHDVEISQGNVISAGVWPAISIYTDKYTYHAGDTMYLGLDVANPDGSMKVCFAVWVVLPDGSIYLYIHMHDIVLPANFSYSNPAFRTIALPCWLPQGNYTWHAAILSPATHKILHEDTAQWEFVRKIDTKMSFNLSPNPAVVGQTITLTGNLTDQYSNPIGHALVKVSYSIDNGVTWVYAGTLQTNSTGWFEAKGKLTVVGYYLIKVLYEGTVVYNPSYHIETLTIEWS